MVIDDTVGADLDSDRERIVVVFNATPGPQTVSVDNADALELHPVQVTGGDAVVKQTSVATDSVTVPARTVAVLEQPE